MKQIVQRSLAMRVYDTFLELRYRNQPLTAYPALVTAVRALDFWHDSTKQKTERVITSSGVVFTRAYERLPLTEETKCSFIDDRSLEWQVTLSSRGTLVLDELKFIFFAHPGYRECFIDEQDFKVPAFTDSERLIGKAEGEYRFAGARCAVDNLIPDIALIGQSSSVRLRCSCEASPQNVQAYLIVQTSLPEEEIVITPQRPVTVSFRIQIYPQRAALDRDIEERRKEKYALKPLPFQKQTVIPYTKDPVIVFVNAPWYGCSCKGIRGGSRWPHLRDESEGDYLPFPFFLAYATAYLKREGFRAHIIDAIAEDISEDVFLERLHALSPDVVVMETSAPSLYNDLEIAQRIAQENVYTVMCGAFSELYSPDFLEAYPGIDAVWVGEIEATALDFARALRRRLPLKDVPGIIFRDGDDIVMTDQRALLDVALLPWPERDSLPMDRYRDTPGNIPLPSVQALSSRGCVFGCDFCLWPQVLFRNTYRARPVKDCIDEMQHLVAKKGFRSLYWDDDTFNISAERTRAFADEIKRRGLQKVPWAMMARPDLMDEPLVDSLRAAGLAAIKYGVESFHAGVQKECSKHIDVRKAERIIRHTRALGVKVHLTFVFGFDSDTEDSIRKTIDYAFRLRPDSVQFSILTPFPGTKLFERLENAGRILTTNWTYYDGHHGCVFRLQHLTPERVKQLKDEAYQRWYNRRASVSWMRDNVSRFRREVASHGLAQAVRKTAGYLCSCREREGRS